MGEKAGENGKEGGGRRRREGYTVFTKLRLVCDR